MDTRILESSASAKKKENQRFITVTVPDPEQIGVKLPGQTIYILFNFLHFYIINFW